MTRLTRRQVVLLHNQMLTATGGLPGIRDENLLDAALAAPYAAFGEVEFFGSVQAKAARLAYGLVANHPFNDGNKRIGVQVMLVFLHLNGIRLEPADDDLVQLGLGLAGGSLDAGDVQAWIASHQAGEQ
ncbi:death on curing protein [Sanguibacter gelidistatuariae]|uniref:Death on curing protein n=1 Tax=Sanguibacter gelidistatuariae TaxID=1814289 RepID=A0A1G6SVI1_9MICO|nr:type II toxin-antitoxin system death-on-curing family toxin [Sanguibacter gelidistatuariae]SDD20316.1 death on curing protein [Sanguibacter gelidistatuariae]